MVFSPYYFWFFLRRFKYTPITVMDAASIPANIPIGVLSPVFMLIFCLIHKFLLFSPLLCKTTENHRSATDNLRFSYYFSIYFASTARIFFRSSSFAIWSFIPAFLAFTTSSANALAVMAMTVLSFYYHTVLWHCHLSILCRLHSPVPSRFHVLSAFYTGVPLFSIRCKVPVLHFFTEPPHFLIYLRSVVFSL